MLTVDHDGLATQRARHDLLLDRATGLPKWELLLDRLDVALAHCRRTGYLVAVYVIDEPQPFGDPGLDIIKLAHDLRALVRAEDTVARIGARRFVLVCNDIRVDEDAAGVARRIISGARVTCRLGIALGAAGITADDLLVEAIAQATQRAVRH